MARIDSRMALVAAALASKMDNCSDRSHISLIPSELVCATMTSYHITRHATCLEEVSAGASHNGELEAFLDGAVGHDGQRLRYLQLEMPDQLQPRCGDCMMMCDASLRTFSLTAVSLSRKKKRRWPRSTAQYLTHYDAM